jgi:hypothetical protein
MKRLLALSFLLAAAAIPSLAQTPAFPFTVYVHDFTGETSDYPLPSIYQFASTAVGSNSNIALKVVNTSGTPAYFAGVLVGADQTTTTSNPNFTITGTIGNISLPVGGSVVFTVNFSPVAAGLITGYLGIYYQVQQDGCDFTSTDPATQCPSGVNLTSTLNATATAPQLVLSYQGTSGSTVLQPSGTPLNFGNISTSAVQPITFTLSNESTVDITVPSISVPPPTVYTASPFVLDTSQVPAVLAAGTSANFTITFEPGQVGLDTSNLLVGSNTYPLQGEGVVIADIDALEISYTDATGVKSLPQAATPISFGQTVAGTAASNVLTFTVTLPSTSYNSVTVSAITVTGAGFTLSPVTGAATFPASVAPGQSLGFTITFTPSNSGNYTGTLSIGDRVFTLSGSSINSPLPSFSVAVNPSPLNSQQQATARVQFASAPSLNLTGTITMSFAPSVANVTDDPAIMFLATSGRTLPLTVTSGSALATYNGQSALSFQTGTTAGTITFAVTLPNTAVYTTSFTITPALVQITSASAVQSDPNLVVTIAGYDNTYSAGQLTFTFYDTSGKQIGSTIAFDATSDFQQLFFNNNTGGGAFSLQATFPVTGGNITQIGSVTVTINNSMGQSSTTQTF